MSKTVKIFGKPVSLIALTLILTSTIAVTGIAAFTAYWSQMKPISVNIVGNVYMFDIYEDELCTIPLQAIAFGDVMQGNDVGNSGFQVAYLKLDVDPTPKDVWFYWSAELPPEFVGNVDFIVRHNGETGDIWEEGAYVQWSGTFGGSLVTEICFELKVNTDVVSGLKNFDVTFVSGDEYAS